MKIKLKINILFFLLLNLVYNPCYCQLSKSDLLKKEAEEFYMSFNYSKALAAYEELIALYPQQSEYQYYAGKCIYELHISDKYDQGAEYLRFAAIKSDKKNAWFYAGRIYHLKGDYGEALKMYKRYLSEVPRTQGKRLNVEQYILAAEKESETKVPEKKSPEVILEQEKLTTDYPNNNAEKTRYLTDEQVYTDIKINDANLKAALRLQIKADSLKRESNLKRAQMKESTDAQLRENLKNGIQILTIEHDRIQKEADSCFLSSMTIRDLTDSATNLSDNEFTEDTGNSGFIKSLTSMEDWVQGSDKFSITEQSQYSSDSLIPRFENIPDTLIYTIQLGIFEKKISAEKFKKISPIYYLESNESEMFRFYGGLFFSFKSASLALVKIRDFGIPDAFIVPYFHKKPISIQKAHEIEYEQFNF